MANKTASTPGSDPGSPGSDAALQSARQGDDGALALLVEEYAPRVLRFARKLCLDEHDAEDVVQQTLLSVAAGIREFRAESQFTSWLYAVARSHCIKLRTRGAAARPSESIDDQPGLVAPGHAPDEQLAQGELELALNQAIAALEPGYREVLVLRDIEGLTAPDVSQVLGVSVEAVKSRLHRARKALRERLAPWFEQSSPGPGCPDVVDLLSRYQEGDVTTTACRTLEAHVEGCAECAKRCHALRRVLSMCNASPLPELNEELRQALRAQIRKSLKRQGV